MRFQIGDIVRMSKSSDVNNKPEVTKKTEGEIIEISNSQYFPIRVRFSETTTNNFKENELSLVRR